jgi:hypothetical protein
VSGSLIVSTNYSYNEILGGDASFGQVPSVSVNLSTSDVIAHLVEVSKSQRTQDFHPELSHRLSNSEPLDAHAEVRASFVMSPVTFDRQR